MSASREAIAHGSKSFYFASLFFSVDVREHVWALYSWCRHCDDQVDHAPDATQAQTMLNRLWQQSYEAFNGNPQPEPFAGLGRVCRRFNIPWRYPVELLMGFAKDAASTRYHSVKEVEQYAYHVAGSVGAIMASIMGVRSQEALPHAISMGNAMQLTNIARDVREDHSRGRIYLPAEWLEASGVNIADMMAPAHRQNLYEVVLQLLNRADELYAHGYQGLKYLPFRCAIAVASAGEIYSAIGRKICKLGPAALDQRVHISRAQKVWLSMRGLGRALRSRY